MKSWDWADWVLEIKYDLLESVLCWCLAVVTSVSLPDLGPASCYWSHISQGWPQYCLSAYLCISVHLLIFSSEVWPPLLLLAGSEGNAPLIMGTCPPNSSRHLTSKQTFVGCRVIGAPASRCKLDTSPVGTNIASPGGLWNVAVLTTTEVRHSLTRFLSQQAAAVGRPRVHLIYWRSKNVRKLVRLDLQKPTIENIWEWKCHSNTKSLGERNNTEYCVWHQLKAAWPLIEQIWH